MLSKFQSKLRSMCKVTRGDEPHWIPTSARVVRVPGSGDVVSLRRAIYAAFVGPLFGGEDVVVTCEVSGCVSPEHLGTEPCRGVASKSLDFSGLSVGREIEKVSVVGAEPVGGHEQTAKIKKLLNQGLSVVDAAARLGIPVGKVVAVHNRAGRTVSA